MIHALVIVTIILAVVFFLWSIYYAAMHPGNKEGRPNGGSPLDTGGDSVALYSAPYSQSRSDVYASNYSGHDGGQGFASSGGSFDSGSSSSDSGGGGGGGGSSD